MKLQADAAKLDFRGLLLVALVGMWSVGILLASVFSLSPLLFLMGAMVGGLGSIIWYRDRRGRLLLLLLLCLCLGAWRLSIAQPAHDPASITAFINTGALQVRGSVTDEPKVQGHTRQISVAVSAVSRDGGKSWIAVDGQVLVETLSTELDDPYGATYGDAVELTGKLQVSPPHSTPDIVASLAFPRIHITAAGGNPIIAWLYHLRATLATMITQILPQPAAALLIALVLGLRTPALKPLTTAFNVTGTAHLIVPSGFKVTILAGLITSSTIWLYDDRRQTQGRSQRRNDWRRWFVTLLIVSSITLYTVLSGAGPAAIRSGVMGILLVLAPRAGRVYNVYTALAGTALAMSAIDPFIFWDAGFQLSFVGTLGIVLLTPYFQRLLRPVERLPGGHLLVEIIAVTLAAQVATLPIFAVTFQQISFVAPLANSLTVPLLSTLIALGLLICVTGLLAMPLAVLCGWIIWPLLWYLQTIIVWCAHLPGAYLSIENLDEGMAWGYYALLAVIVGLLLHIQQASPQHTPHASPGLTRRTWHMLQLGLALFSVAATALSIATTRPDGLLTVSFLDVGPAGQPSQGEALLIHTPDGRTALIDGGLDATALGEALDSRLPPWQHNLDTVILTCPRADHLTGLQDIVTRYAIGDVLDAGMLHPSTTYARWRRSISERDLTYIRVVQGTTIPLGTDVALHVLWPPSQLHRGSNEVRDNGLIALLVAPGFRLLLLGASAQSSYALAGLLTTFPSNMLQATIVQMVGGQDTPAPVELADVLHEATPSLLVITPASLSAAQRKAGGSSGTSAPPSWLSSWTAIHTAQLGTLTVTSSAHGWSTQLA